MRPGNRSSFKDFSIVRGGPRCLRLDMRRTRRGPRRGEYRHPQVLRSSGSPPDGVPSLRRWPAAAQHRMARGGQPQLAHLAKYGEFDGPGVCRAVSRLYGAVTGCTQGTEVEIAEALRVCRRGPTLIERVRGSEHLTGRWAKPQNSPWSVPSSFRRRSCIMNTCYTSHPHAIRQRTPAASRNYEIFSKGS